MWIDGVLVKIAKEQRIFENPLHRNGKNVAQSKFPIFGQFLAFLNLGFDLLILA